MPSSSIDIIDLRELRQKLNPTPCNIVRQLCEAGYEAYIVGGAIRDLLLGRTPKDYDISTSATPEEVRSVFGRRRCHVIGRRFRLAHVYSNGDIYEVSTFRRRPNAQERQGLKSDSGPIIWNDNCFGTMEEDALRRDFTVNGLYFDVVGKRGIIDLCGGLKDIKKGLVRCIGEPDERLAEDPVRILRALKLVGQCGFTLEKNLDKAIRRHNCDITLSSQSRLFEELLKLLNNPSASQTLQVMHDYGFLAHFWPTLDASWTDQEGEMVRHLLDFRGVAIRQGGYSNSRGLALSTVALPFMMSALNPGDPLAFWDHSPSNDLVAHRALNLIFEGFQIPHILFLRILQIIGLVPQLLKPSPPVRAMNHKEYRYGRAIVALLVQLFGWDRAMLDNLPEFSPRYAFPETAASEESAGSGRQAESGADTADSSSDGRDAANAASSDHLSAKRKRRRRRNSRSRHKEHSAPPAGETN